MRALAVILPLLLTGAEAFSLGRLIPGARSRPAAVESTINSRAALGNVSSLWAVPTTPSSAAEIDETLASNREVLFRAAESKTEDPDAVLAALESTEKLMRQKCKIDPSAADEVLRNLDGSWRLIFTTGTKETQDKIQAKVNYFPIKAMQSFDTSVSPYRIENGIYLGDFAVLKFGGIFDFDLRKRRLEFDFTSVSVLGFKISIKSEDAAQLGASTGLGSKGNVANAAKGNRPFFNWIDADSDIATARGGGGGLALWRRVIEE